MSLWEMHAAIDGYGLSQGWKANEPVETMTVEKLRELGVDGF